MADYRPYTVSVPDLSLDRLHRKLKDATFPDELEEADWDHGAPLADVKRLAKYWREGYDWRKHESEFNGLPQFMTKVPVDGFGELDVHFVHQQSPIAEAIPLLFVQGPGSFLEVSKLLSLLVDRNPRDPAFHVVAISLPNFGLSQGVKKRGFGLPQYAEVCHNLMLKLAYDKYVTQGGDWGFWITRTIGRLYPSACIVSHVNMMRANLPSMTSNPLIAIENAMNEYSAQEQLGLKRSQWFRDQGSGYSAIQSTKPQTLGYGLADSPVMLLAWILEKLHDWTDAYPWTDDEILTWASIYLFSTAGPAASIRIYYEALHEEGKVSVEAAKGYIPHVKLALAYFWHDVEVVPKSWARGLGDVVYESEHDRGGHFAAWERPDAIAKDIKSMYERDGAVYGILKAT